MDVGNIACNLFLFRYLENKRENNTGKTTLLHMYVHTYLNVYTMATGAASSGYALVPKAGNPGYTFVPRAGSPQYTPVIGLVALNT